MPRCYKQELDLTEWYEAGAEEPGEAAGRRDQVSRGPAAQRALLGDVVDIDEFCPGTRPG